MMKQGEDLRLGGAHGCGLDPDWGLVAVCSSRSCEVFEIDRLDEVGVEPCEPATAACLRFAVAGHGDQGDFRECGIFAAEAGHFVAIHDRQPDIEQDDVGPVVAGHFEGLLSVVGNVDFLARGRRAAFRGWPRFLDYRRRRGSAGAAGAIGSSASRFRLCSRDRGRFGTGKADGEFTSLAGALAMDADAAFVHFDQRADDGQPDAQAAARAREGLIGLDEQIEELGQELRRDSDAVVGDA